MHDHRTGDGPSDDPSDRVSAEASAFAAGVERWLAGGGEPPSPDLEEVQAAAVAEAWSILFDALQVALGVPGLSDEAAAELAHTYERASRLSGREANLGLLERRRTSAQHERCEWFQEHGEVAQEEGGILRWEELPEHLRWLLFGERVLTVAQVAALAAAGRLCDVHGIGPARQREIMRALGEVGL